jgi:hypothetical protein
MNSLVPRLIEFPGLLVNLAHDPPQFTRSAKKYPPCGKSAPTFCHSERSEESLFLFAGLNPGEIPRFARNDKINCFFQIDYFFRSLYRLNPLAVARRAIRQFLHFVFLHQPVA